MRFSQEFIETVRSANSIADLIGQYTELKGSGARLMGRCPFPDHSDKSPSFSVNEDTQLYHCFGCKKSGNVYTFLQTFNGMSFPEAVEFLARRVSIPLPENDASTDNKEKRNKKDWLLKANQLVALHFQKNLSKTIDNHKVRQYLKLRGLDRDVIEKFRLGYAPDEWQALAHFLQSKKVPLGLAESLGLLRPKKASRPGDSHFDLFRDRLMFPIVSSSGDVLGFGGRTLTDALPKYVNSPESPIFHKGQVLYGLNETGKYIRAADEAIVVEGYMDAISLYSQGIKNVVAILGTAFTADHAKLIKRYTLNVKVLLDGDEAGLNGAERSLPLLLEAGLLPKGFVLPDGMDPDDFVKKRGAEVLVDEIQKAPDLFTLILTRRWMVDYRGTASDKVRVMELASRVLHKTQDRQLADLYILELSRQLDVDLPWIRRYLYSSRDKGSSVAGVNQSGGGSTRAGKDVVRTAARAEGVVPQSGRSEDASFQGNPSALPKDGDTLGDKFSLPNHTQVELKGAPRDEAFVLSLLLHSETLIRDLLEAGPEELLEMLSHEGIRRIAALALENYRQDPSSFGSLAASLASKIDQPGILTCSLEITNGISGETEERRLMSDYLNAIRKRYLNTQARALAQQLKDHASPEKLEQFMNIQRSRLAIDRD